VTARDVLELIHSNPSTRFRLRGEGDERSAWSCVAIEPRFDVELGERTVMTFVIPKADARGTFITSDPTTRRPIVTRIKSRLGGGVEAELEMDPEQLVEVAELEPLKP
jgi:hypothetical protein